MHRREILLLSTTYSTASSLRLQAAGMLRGDMASLPIPQRAVGAIIAVSLIQHKQHIVNACCLAFLL